jgi:hypothetical protein
VTTEAAVAQMSTQFSSFVHKLTHSIIKQLCVAMSFDTLTTLLQPIKSPAFHSNTTFITAGTTARHTRHQFQYDPKPTQWPAVSVV